MAGRQFGEERYGENGGKQFKSRSFASPFTIHHIASTSKDSKPSTSTPHHSSFVSPNIDELLLWSKLFSSSHKKSSLLHVSHNENEEHSFLQLQLTRWRSSQHYLHEENHLRYSCCHFRNPVFVVTMLLGVCGIALSSHLHRPSSDCSA